MYVPSLWTIHLILLSASGTGKPWEGYSITNNPRILPYSRIGDSTGEFPHSFRTIFFPPFFFPLFIDPSDRYLCLVDISKAHRVQSCFYLTIWRTLPWLTLPLLVFQCIITQALLKYNALVSVLMLFLLKDSVLLSQNLLFTCVIVFWLQSFLDINISPWLNPCVCLLS